MTTTAHSSTPQFDLMHAVKYFDDRFAVKPPVNALQSPSTSQTPRQIHSIVHHELLLNNCVLFQLMSRQEVMIVV